MGIEGLLDTRPITGPTAIERAIGPATTARALVANDPQSLCRCVEEQCALWGGPAGPLFPYRSNVIDPLWRRYLSDCDIDVILPEDQRGAVYEALGPASGNLLYRPLPIPVVAVLAAIGKPRDNYRQVDVPAVSSNDPWWLAYAAQFGRWPVSPDNDVLERYFIVPETTHDMVIPTSFENVEGSGDDFFERTTKRTTLTPIEASLVSLTYPIATRTWPATSGILPTPYELANEYGPDIIVIYSPEGADDLALLWALRAANGWPRGRPVGVPVSLSKNEVARWVRQARGMSLTGYGVAITSVSVPVEELEKIANDHPCVATVVPPEILLRPPVWPSRPSSGIAYFIEGFAQTRNWSTSDVDNFPRAATLSKNLETKIRVSIATGTARTPSSMQPTAI